MRRPRHTVAGVDAGGGFDGDGSHVRRCDPLSLSSPLAQGRQAELVGKARTAVRASI
jgi:hypothetical protein